MKLLPTAVRRLLKRKTSKCYLLSLPVDMILEIAKHLDDVSFVILSVSCSALEAILLDEAIELYRSLDENYIHRVSRSRAYIIRQLERGSTGHRSSSVGFNWLRRAPLPFTARGPRYYNYVLDALGGWGIPHMSLIISYYCANQVMNRHRLGPNAGLPLWVLEKDRKTKPACDHDLEWGWRARIIDDELFLSGKLIIHLRLGCGFPNRVQTSRWEALVICEHSRRRGTQESSPTGHAEFEGTQGHCDRCRTDYDISAQQPFAKQKAAGGDMEWAAQVTIRTYHCFGRCDSPAAWEAGNWSFKKPRRWRSRPDVPRSEADFGDVRKRWLEVGGQE